MIGVLLMVGIVTAVMTRGPHRAGAGPELAQRKLTLQHFVAKFDVVPDMVGLTYNGFDILAGG